MDDELEAEIDRLYALPLTEFVAARNALAKRLRGEKRRHDAKTIAELAKPTVSAWTVNQLWYAQRVAFVRLLERGDEVRAAQRDVLGGGDPQVLRKAQQAQREQVRVLIEAAEGLLAQAGSAATGATLRRVQTTLEALAAYGTRQPPPRPGRLVEDREAPGFEALLTMDLPEQAEQAEQAERAEQADQADQADQAKEAEDADEAIASPASATEAQPAADPRALEALEEAQAKVHWLYRKHRREAEEAERMAEAHTAAEARRRQALAAAERLRGEAEDLERRAAEARRRHDEAAARGEAQAEEAAQAGAAAEAARTRAETTEADLEAAREEESQLRRALGTDQEA